MTELRTWPAGTVAPVDATPHELNLHMTLWGSVLVMTPASLTAVPNQPKTPMRSFRIPDPVYRAAQEKAAAKGESVSDVVRRALERYAKRG